MSKSTTETVWFLTIIKDGHVSLTSIIAANAADAGNQTYKYFTDFLGKATAWKMSEVEYQPKLNSNLSMWEIENVDGSYIRASLMMS